MTAGVPVGHEEAAQAIAAILVEIRGETDGWLDLVGFWRLFGGGGQCRVRHETEADQWVGTVADREGTAPRHVPAACRFSTGRVEDFLRVARCHRQGPGQWAAHYEEPAIGA